MRAYTSVYCSGGISVISLPGVDSSLSLVHLYYLTVRCSLAWWIYNDDIEFFSRLLQSRHKCSNITIYITIKRKKKTMSWCVCVSCHNHSLTCMGEKKKKKSSCRQWSVFVWLWGPVCMTQTKTLTISNFSSLGILLKAYIFVCVCVCFVDGVVGQDVNWQSICFSATHHYLVLPQRLLPSCSFWLRDVLFICLPYDL